MRSLAQKMKKIRAVEFSRKSFKWQKSMKFAKEIFGGQVLKRPALGLQCAYFAQSLSDGKSLLQVGLSVCRLVGRSVCPQNEIQNEIQKATNNICTQKLHIIKPSLRRGLSRLLY